MPAGVVFESRFEPRFVRAILKQTADEIRHSRDQFADRRVFAQTQIEFDRGALQLVAHAEEHLQFERRLRKSTAFDRGKCGGDRASVMAAEREFDAAFSQFRRC